MNCQIKEFAECSKRSLSLKERCMLCIYIGLNLSDVREKGWTTEIDTLEYHQTKKIETEVKDVDRIRAPRCTQRCPGCPSGASHLHNIRYYSPPCRQPPPPSRKGTPRWRVLYRITRQLLHRVRCGNFSQKIETANPAQLSYAG